MNLQETKDFTNWLVKKILFIFFGFLIGLAIANFFIPYDSTDNKNKKERSGMKIYTDNKSGCQYLATRKGHLTPRLEYNKRHMGCE